MNRSRSRILLPFFRSVTMSRIMRLLFATTSTSHYSISIALCYAYAIIYTSVACYTFDYTSMDNYSSFATTFSSLASLCIVYASTKCYSSALSSSNSSMHTRSTNVALVLFALLHANIICLCTNCIFSLYAFPSAHSKNDDELMLIRFEYCSISIRPFIDTPLTASQLSNILTYTTTHKIP